MTAQYLDEILTGSPEKRELAASLRGRLGLHAREGDVRVTVVFGERGIAIEEGLCGPDAVIDERRYDYDPNGNITETVYDPANRVSEVRRTVNGVVVVTRTEYDGKITVLADRFEGKRFNAPNDVVCKSDGSIWFTDPPFGITGNY